LDRNGTAGPTLPGARLAHLAKGRQLRQIIGELAYPDDSVPILIATPPSAADPRDRFSLSFPPAIGMIKRFAGTADDDVAAMGGGICATVWPSS